MNENKLKMVEQAKEMLTNRMHIYEEKANGHLRVNGCDFWATSGKWFDPKENKRGQGGLREFIMYIEGK